VVSAGAGLQVGPVAPAGDFPIRSGADSYDTMLSSGEHTFRNYLLFRFRLTQPLTRWLWGRTLPSSPEGANLADAAEIRQQLTIPVLCTGGFQTASYVRRAIADGLCDGVAIARPLLANPNLVHQWAQGRDVPDRPCSYCNKCLFHVLEDPLGCYDVRRYDGDHDRMIHELMAFYEPDGFQDLIAPP
jgi:hypothetical protein